MCRDAAAGTEIWSECPEQHRLGDREELRPGSAEVKQTRPRPVGRARALECELQPLHSLKKAEKFPLLLNQTWSCSFGSNNMGQNSCQGSTRDVGF